MTDTTDNNDLPELQRRIMEALPEYTQDHFAYHATDLYVIWSAALSRWLKKNYEFYELAKGFTSPKDSDWLGAGYWCIDIPFAGRWKNPDA